MSSLPDKSVTFSTFHRYKDPLMNSKKLPQEIIVSPADFEILYRVLKHHPRFAEKKGCGVKDIFVRRSIVHGEDVCCSYVRRKDGSEEDFSVFKPYRTISHKDNGRRFDASEGALKTRQRQYWE